jgi:hypothetical protein
MSEKRTVVEVGGTAAKRTRLFQREIAQAHHDREHLWVATLTFRVTPPLRDGAMLAVEDLRAGPVAFCMMCERTFTPEVDPVCPGDAEVDRLLRED